MTTASTPMPRNRVQDSFWAALQRSGIKKRASVHTLPHRSATPLLEAGGKLRLIQDSLGHNTPTTPALYTPLTLTADAMAREALTERMSALCAYREVTPGRVGRDLPAPWTRVSGAGQRP
jgi:site-specific recombinase XerD